MPLTPGALLGPYEVSAAIGEGGMGEVYRARDTKLNRDVALKVLPDAFTHDPERLARFQREAKVLASLNHPNIAQIHGLEDSGETHALVLELVEGATLAERIARGPIPVDEALTIARQIAEALEAAHERGIIHRDLKPANIKLRPDGTVKVLDFGLAKALGGEPVEAEQANSPTLTAAASQSGVILGTVAYMSPEQARGQPADRRADVWALGCVLYEMLAGRPVFAAASVSETLVATLTGEPAWSGLPVGVSPQLRRLLRRCLAKDRQRRFQHIGDVRIEITEVQDEPAAPLPTSAPTPERKSAIVWAVAGGSAAAVLLLGTLAGWRWNSGGEADGVGRGAGGPPSVVSRVLLDVRPAEGLQGSNPLDRTSLGQRRPSQTAIALSPDGRALVFGAHRGEDQRLYVRHLDRPEAVPLEGTESGESPFFAPDGNWIGFWADGQLRKVSLAGQPPVTVAETGRLFGASWGADEIVFAQFDSGLWSVPADGGQPTPVTTVEKERGEARHWLPHVLPDGRGLIFTVLIRVGDWANARVVARTPGGDTKVLVQGAADARYVPTGHLIYLRVGTLVAVAFDLDRLEVIGGETVLVENVMQSINPFDSRMDSGAGQFTHSGSGSLVYLTGGVTPGFVGTLVWIDRDGTVEAIPTPAPPRAYFAPRLSPDGRHVAVATLGLDDLALWNYDLARGTLLRLSPNALTQHPVWRPGGREIAFTMAVGDYGGFLVPADGSQSPRTIPGVPWPSSWSPDGRFLVFVRDDDVHVFDFEGEPTTLLDTPARERMPELSPDGRWLAYVSDETGRSEVYVRSFPELGAKHQVSVEGGLEPAWAKGGAELVYLVPITRADGQRRVDVMSVDVRAEPTFSASVPSRLFDLDAEAFPGAVVLRDYDVTPDGSRFLFVREDHPPIPPAPSEMHLVLNWHRELLDRVPIP